MTDAKNTKLKLPSFFMDRHHPYSFENKSAWIKLSRPQDTKDTQAIVRRKEDSQHFENMKNSAFGPKKSTTNDKDIGSNIRGPRKPYKLNKKVLDAYNSETDESDSSSESESSSDDESQQSKKRSRKLDKPKIKNLA